MLLTDAAQLKSTPTKIISLVPSITELLHYLNLDKEVTGITKFCTHPTEWFRHKNKIGGTKTPNLKRIHELQPDLIIASKEENVKEQVEELAASFNVWVTDVCSVQDAYNMIKDVGILTGKAAESRKLITDIKKEFARLPGNSHPLKAAYIIWRMPYMTIGGDTFINDMMQHCGLENVFASDKRYPKITPEDILASGCKLVLLSSEPYPFKEKHIKELQPHLPGIRIVLADGEMFSWYGSRMLQMPQYLPGLLNTVKSH